MIAAPRRRDVAWLLASALALTGCAPRPAPQALDGDALRVRYEAALETRRERASAIESRAALWLETTRAGSWPGVMADVRVAGPRRVRLLVRSPLGTLLDAAGDGDRVSVAFPRRHAWGEFDASRESLGVERPVDLAIRAVTALWSPPDTAWAGAVAVPGGRALRWSEDRLRLEMSVAADGLPFAILAAGDSGAAVRIRYDRWAGALGTRWPSELRVADGAGLGELRCRIEGWRAFARNDSARLGPVSAAGNRIDGARMRQWLARLVEP